LWQGMSAYAGNYTRLHIAGQTNFEDRPSIARHCDHLRIFDYPHSMPNARRPHFLQRVAHLLRAIPLASVDGDPQPGFLSGGKDWLKWFSGATGAIPR